MSPLVFGGMLEVSVNTLSAGGKYFVQDCQNFPLPIQEQLSEKGKSFSQFFVSFPESTSYLKDFLEKDDYVFQKVQTVKNLLTPLSKKVPFQNTL